MASQSPHGIVPAIITPFRENERIDYASWQTLIELQIAAGVDGIFAAGGQGEFFSLTEEERIVTLRFCRQAVNKRVPLYGNVGCITTRQTIDLAQKAEAEGIDYAVVITPFYLKPTEWELIDHYVEICRAVHIPVLAYNIPERTGLELTPGMVMRIASQCENFVGLKDSSGKLEQIPEFVAIGRDRPFSVFMGRDHMILSALKMGCAGAVTACANVAPKAFVELYRAFREGDMEKAARLQALIDPLRQAFSLHTFPSVVKEAMNRIGLSAGPCRRPVGPMPAEARVRLEAVLETLREEQLLPEASAGTKAGGQD